MNNQLTYTYEHYQADFKRLLEQIRRGNEEYEYIVGLVRGGLPLAVSLSHALDTPMIALQWQSRDGQVRELTRTIMDALEQNKRILIVDDIIDSGASLMDLTTTLGARVKNVDIAVLYYNPSQPVKPDFYARLIDRTIDQRWINFWWEECHK